MLGNESRFTFEWVQSKSLPALPESSGTYKVNNRHALMTPL